MARLGRGRPRGALVVKGARAPNVTTFTSLTLAVPCYSVGTKTLALAVAVVEKSLGVRGVTGIVDTDTCSVLTERVADLGTGTPTLSVTSGAIKIATTSVVAEFDAKKQCLAAIDAHVSPPDLVLATNGAVCLDVFYTGTANTSAALVGLRSDANNWYQLDVAKTAGGTSTLYDSKSGAKTSRGTVAKGVATDTWKRVKLYMQGTTVGVIVDGTHTSYVDASKLTGSLNVVFGAKSSGGSATDYRIDNIDIAQTNQAQWFGLPTGYSVRLYDGSTDAVVASAVESSNVATLDLTQVVFPFTGYFQVFTDGASYSTLATGYRYPTTGNVSVRGGDQYHYNLSDWRVIGDQFHSGYGTTQSSSHNGAISHSSGDLEYGVAMGYQGSLVAWQRSIATGIVTTHEIGAAGSVTDKHASCDMQVDSSGYFHVIGDGSLVGSDCRYYKSTSPWDITAWSAPFSLGACQYAMLIDQADVVHLLGVKATATHVQQQIVHRKNTAGSWSSETVIANGYTAGGQYWTYFIGDIVLGQETSGQKSLHGCFFTYDATTGTYKNNYYVRSTDGGATWKGLTGAAYSLPVNMTAGGTVALDTVFTSSGTGSGSGGYVSRFTVEPGGTVHLVGSIVGATDHFYIQGSTSTGWAAASYTFSESNETHGAIEKIGTNLIYVIAKVAPASIIRFRSIDSGVTWSKDTMIDAPSDYPPQWYWPKLTPVPGASYVKCLWQSRQGAYTGAGSTLTNGGASGLFIANVSILAQATLPLAVKVLVTGQTKTLALAVAVNAGASTGTKTQAVAVKVFGRLTKTQSLAVAVTATPPTTSTATRPFYAPLTVAPVYAPLDANPMYAPLDMDVEV